MLHFLSRLFVWQNYRNIQGFDDICKGRCPKKTFFWDFFPNIGPHPPTAHVWDSTKWKVKVKFILLFRLFRAFYFFEKMRIFFDKIPNSKIFGALKHHEMARYDLPTYVLHVLGHFWMFAVKITEWIFSLKSLGLWTWTWTHLPIVWDKVPNKSGFFLTPSLIIFLSFCLPVSV